jgi:hypothetical protein
MDEKIAPLGRWYFDRSTKAVNGAALLVLDDEQLLF